MPNRGFGMINIAIILLPLGLLSIALITHFTFSINNAEQDTTTIIALHPRTTIFLFDLHGVVFKPDYKRMIRIFWQSKHKILIIKHALNPKILYKIHQLSRKKAVAEEYFVHLSTYSPQLKQAMPLFMEMANAQKPVDPIISLVKTLKQSGYSLHVLSNIGEQFFAHLKDNFDSLFKEFDQIKVSTAAEHYLGKPHPQIFYNYLQQCNPSQKQVVFIDNKHANIKAAQELGIIGLHFTNANRLKKQLEQLHLVL